MSEVLPPALTRLIEELSKLPGIGPKTAARLAFWLLSKPAIDVERLGHVIEVLPKDIRFCERCGHVTDVSAQPEDSTNIFCGICRDPRRNEQQLAVVEQPLDVIALEKTSSYHGLYHVLGGVLSPIDGIGPEQLRIASLLERLKVEPIAEVILATNPSLEGESTALYISQRLPRADIQLTRIARGLPVGGDLEYADELTLSRAIEGRQRFE